MNKQDRNTAITIAVVLLVCVVALVAVGSALWRTIRPGVEQALATVGIFIGSTTTSYNFEVPGQNNQPVNPPAPSTDGANNPPPPPPSTTPISLSYNFAVDNGSSPEPMPTQFNIKDGILSDFNRADYQSGHLGDSRLTVEIPKLQFSSKVQVNLPADAALQNGLAFFPTSHKHNEGEVVLGCYRRYQPPQDSKSCWYLDSLSAGDELYVIDNGTETKYTIVGVGEFPANSDQVYTSDSKSNQYLRIVTAHPLNGLSQRLVVLAQRDA